MSESGAGPEPGVVEISGVRLPVREFVTEQKNSNGMPLVRGVILNMAQWPGDPDDLMGKQDDLVRVVRAMGAESTGRAMSAESKGRAMGAGGASGPLAGAESASKDTDADADAEKKEEKEVSKFSPPYMVMDMALKKDVKILLRDADGNFTRPWSDEADCAAMEGGKANMVEEGNDTRPLVKVLMPCLDIVDLTSIGTPVAGLSVVKCNASVPNYRWFQAANLLLKHNDKPGRVIPFPLEQEDGSMMYHMLRVGPEEFRAYQELLDYSVKQDGALKGFEISAKFAYEILSKRGVPFEKLTHEVVDKTMTHVHMMGDSRIRGVLLVNTSREELEDMQESHYIFY